MYWYLFKLGFWGGLGSAFVVDLVGAPFVGRDIIK